MEKPALHETTAQCVCLNYSNIHHIQWLSHISRAANMSNDAETEESLSFNKSDFGKSSPWVIGSAPSVTADHWLNNSTVRDESPVSASLGCSLGSWLYIQTFSTPDHSSQG